MRAIFRRKGLTLSVDHEEGQAVYLISGPMAAGKTTAAGLLAARFTRGVHLEGDSSGAASSAAGPR